MTNAVTRITLFFESQGFADPDGHGLKKNIKCRGEFAGLICYMHSWQHTRK